MAKGNRNLPFDTKLPNRYYSELLVGDKNLIEA